MKKNLFISFALLSITLCLSTVFAHSVFATETKANVAMQVTPVIEELSLNPATRVDKTITITNPKDQALKVRIYIAPYSISTENGASDFESQSEYTQIYHWIKIQGQDSDFKDEAEFSIGPGKTETINYRIVVPESAPGSSQHACLFVETIPENTESSNNITTISRAAIKIFADVSGETKKDAEIIRLNTDTFVIDGKVSASTAVKNIGNIDIKPILTLKINRLNGETVFSDTKVAMIFPENSGEIKVEWPETPTFGVYKLIASVNILGKNSIVEKIIFVLPGWFILLFILAITVIIITISRLRRKNKRKRVTRR